MYKMSKDDALLLREVISNLEAEIRDAKESGNHDEYWISQMLFRRSCLKRRLAQADIVPVEELERRMMDSEMVISPGEYHILQTSISKCREMIQMAWMMREDPKWKARIKQIKQELRDLINEDLSCIVVPERLIPHRSVEPVVEPEELVFKSE